MDRHLDKSTHPAVSLGKAQIKAKEKIVNVSTSFFLPIICQAHIWESSTKSIQNYFLNFFLNWGRKKKCLVGEREKNLFCSASFHLTNPLPTPDRSAQGTPKAFYHPLIAISVLLFSMVICMASYKWYLIINTLSMETIEKFNFI